MTYFDLNIPYHDPHTPTRLKLAVKSLELGYTAVAYNRSIKGVISDRDICSIPPLPLASALKLSPNLQSSAAFHRDLLGVPAAAPVRQYTRLTVTVDGLVQCQALNKGNSVLKSYDLVAVRPTNQAAFDYVCNSGEVDLISIDFTVPLPFKMKFQNLEAALKRGVYFEISYSPLISDVSTRKQMIHTTQLLVQWTCGKNLILSSGAASVNEIRGPCDVANLSTLLGISTERAKAALSKNCRSLLLNVVRKNQCYNNAIKVESVPSIKSGDSKSKEAWFCDENDWDHVSSSEGGVLLDQIAKSFAATSEISKAKTIHFASCSYKSSSRGSQLKDPLPVSCGIVNPPPTLSVSKEFGVSTDEGQVSEPVNKLRPDHMAGRMSSTSSSSRNQPSGGLNFAKSSSRDDNFAVSTDANGIAPISPAFKESNGSDGAFLLTVDVNAQGKLSKDCELECPHVTSEKDTQAFDFHGKSGESPVVNMHPSSSLPVCIIENTLVDAIGTDRHSTLSNEMALTFPCNESDTSHNGSDRVLGVHDRGAMGVLHDKEKWENTSAVLARCDMFVDKDLNHCNTHVEHIDPEVSNGDDERLIESFSEIQADKHSHAEVVLREGALVKTDDKKKLKPGIHNKKCKENARQHCSDPNPKERFFELCLQEFDNGSRSGETLTLSSWVRLRKQIKKEFGKNYSVRRLKMRFEHLKKRYHIYESSSGKIGHTYNIATKTIDVSPETSNDGSHKNGLQVDTGTPSLQQSKASLKEPVEFKSNNHRSAMPHAESISCAKTKLQQADIVRTTGKGRKRPTVTALHSEYSPHAKVKSQRDIPVKVNGTICKKRRVASSQTS